MLKVALRQGQESVQNTVEAAEQAPLMTHRQEKLEVPLSLELAAVVAAAQPVTTAALVELGVHIQVVVAVLEVVESEVQGLPMNLEAVMEGLEVLVRLAQEAMVAQVEFQAEVGAEQGLVTQIMMAGRVAQEPLEFIHGR